MAEEVREEKTRLYETYVKSPDYKRDVQVKKRKTPLVFQAPAVHSILNKLSAEKKEHFENLAAEWNAQSPPEEIQRKWVDCATFHSH
jgi:hypothetical protein